jgi:predicted anti-sigma-YlaC factor YlaD
MITCQELTTFLDDFLAGECTARERRLIDEHLTVCPDCQRYLEQYRRTVELGRSAFADHAAPVPADVPAGLLRALLAIRR